MTKNNPMLTLEFRLGDVAQTPMRRRAIVIGFMSDKVHLRYLDDHEQVLLAPKHLLLIARGPREDRGSS